MNDEPIYRSSDGSLRVGNQMVLGFRVDGVGRCVVGNGEMFTEIMQVLEKYDPAVSLQTEILIAHGGEKFHCDCCSMG